MREKNAFTLIELLAVMMILVVLAGLAITRIIPKTEEVKRQAAQADIESNLSLALDLYALENGSYPTTEQGLEALRTKPTTPPVPESWKGPYLKKGLPKDPWGHEYVYEYQQGAKPLIFSLGRDGQPNTADDIRAEEAP